jgi:predicted phosphoribosyltransferase
MFLHIENKIFRDRKDAGEQLGKVLKEEYFGKDVLVLGIPRGGLQVAYYVAKELNCELSVLISKKLPYPGQEELAVGAVAEDGSNFVSRLASRLDSKTISAIITTQMSEIKRRVKQYRNNRPLPEMLNRIVIIVDDGIATGSTIVPALKLCKERKAKSVVVAVPVSGLQPVPELQKLADKIVVLERPEFFYAVGQVYEEFNQLTDKEVTTILEKYNAERNNNPS